MGQRSLAEVLFAVSGVYLIVARLPELGMGIALFVNRETLPGAIDHSALESLSLVVPIASACVGALLLVQRQRIAQVLFKGSVSSETSFSLIDLQSALFAVLGAYVAIGGIGSLISTVFVIDSDQSIASLWPYYSGPLFQILAGIVLFLGAHGLANAWSATRHAGRDRSEL